MKVCLLCSPHVIHPRKLPFHWCVFAWQAHGALDDCLDIVAMLEVLKHVHPLFLKRCLLNGVLVHCNFKKRAQTLGLRVACLVLSSALFPSKNGFVWLFHSSSFLFVTLGLIPALVVFAKCGTIQRPTSGLPGQQDYSRKTGTCPSEIRMSRHFSQKACIKRSHLVACLAETPESVVQVLAKISGLHTTSCAGT